MSMIQLRNVPEEMHRELKARAARRGKTLSDYATEELARSLQRPDLDELLEKLSRYPTLKGSPGAQAVRADRDAQG
ncbi:FitA-like ribbon-helix-helix domain-containing protein [Nesterenkonia ebinurensis]|uniref:FitA-like ribbon-helix-helix domain-containing protein n=1 Tax=Nesterenkonia ebinurensis TaxID=2608252 RepID=UPI00123E192C|nr:hypothetical protein [Nesterenkonia ebinurensis]